MQSETNTSTAIGNVDPTKQTAAPQTPFWDGWSDGFHLTCRVFSDHILLVHKKKKVSLFLNALKAQVQLTRATAGSGEGGRR